MIAKILVQPSVAFRILGFLTHLLVLGSKLVLAECLVAGLDDRVDVLLDLRHNCTKVIVRYVALALGIDPIEIRLEFLELLSVRLAGDPPGEAIQDLM